MSNLGIGTIAEGSDESSAVSSVPSDDDFGSDSDLQSSASSDAPDSDSEGMPSDSEDDDVPDTSDGDDAPDDSDDPSSVDISSDEDSEEESAPASPAAPAHPPAKKGTGKSLAGRRAVRRPPSPRPQRPLSRPSWTPNSATSPWVWDWVLWRLWLRRQRPRSM